MDRSSRFEELLDEVASFNERLWEKGVSSPVTGTFQDR